MELVGRPAQLCTPGTASEVCPSVLVTSGMSGAPPVSRSVGRPSHDPRTVTGWSRVRAIYPTLVNGAHLEVSRVASDARTVTTAGPEPM